jgi:hypothetical protein
LLVNGAQSGNVAQVREYAAQFARFIVYFRFLIGVKIWMPKGKSHSPFRAEVSFEQRD